jgi:hypothetical protein
MHLNCAIFVFTLILSLIVLLRASKSKEEKEKVWRHYKSINTDYLDQHIAKIRNKYSVNQSRNGESNVSNIAAAGTGTTSSKNSNEAVAPKIFLLVFSDQKTCAQTQRAEHDFDELYKREKDLDEKRYEIAKNKNQIYTNTSIIFFKISIDLNREIKYRFDIDSYPTFLVLDAISSTFYKFLGNRSIENLKAFWDDAQNFTNLVSNSSYSHKRGEMREFEGSKVSFPMRVLIETKDIAVSVVGTGGKHIRSFNFMTPEVLFIFTTAVLGAFFCRRLCIKILKQLKSPSEEKKNS